jgi:hypothetical protein
MNFFASELIFNALTFKDIFFLYLFTKNWSKFNELVNKVEKINKI